MEGLKEILDSTVDKSKFDLGKRQERRTQIVATYSRDPQDIIIPDKMRAFASRENWGDEIAAQARSARVILSDEAFGHFLEAFKDLFEDFIDVKTGKIGHTFPMDSANYSFVRSELNGVTVEGFVSPVNEFANVLVRAAAILGTEKLTNMISRWIEKECVKYRTSAILNGLHLNTMLKPFPGVRIEPLPRSTDGKFGSLPFHGSDSIEDYLGRTMISIESTVSPAFFRPEDESTVQANFVSNIEPEMISQALALESYRYVEVAFSWNDYQDASLYLSPGSKSSRSKPRVGLDSRMLGFSLQKDYSSGVKTLSIDEENISHLSEKRFSDLISTLSKQNDERLRVALSRWCKSNESFKTLADRFIDLRVALEALFLRDIKGEKNQEMGFRLAMNGAWFLGNGFKQRKEFRKTLRGTYHKASHAVHNGDVERNKENLTLLAKGQRLCRLGIIKLLIEGDPHDWGDLILGIKCDNKRNNNST